MKIAHVSDLHIDAVNKKDNYPRALHLFEYINDTKYDHIFITGDITENGDIESMELARKLFGKFGLLSTDKLSIVIGNHDIYGGVHLAEDIINYPAKCRQTSFHKKVRQFGFYFREAFENTKQTGKNLFPYIKELDEIIITGFNSNSHYSILKNPFASNGKISSQQLKDAEKLITETEHSGKLNFALTHHHFYREKNFNEESGSTIWHAIERQTMKLRGKKEIIKKFREMDINAVFHGHFHENRDYFRKKIRFLNSGASVTGDKNLALNEITINARKISTEIIKVDLPEKLTEIRTPDIDYPSANYAKLSRNYCLN